MNLTVEKYDMTVIIEITSFYHLVEADIDNKTQLY